MTAAPDAAGPALRLSSGRGRWVLAATVLGSSMAFLDSTVVNVALPTIGRDLHASLGGLQWTVNGYTLSLAGLILLGGSLGDRLGRRRVFMIGVVWFALASAAVRVRPEHRGAHRRPGCWRASAGRCSRRDRWPSSRPPSPRRTGPARSAPGPAWAAWRARSARSLGGCWCSRPGWRWVFFLNLPLAVVVLVVARRHVPESRDETTAGKFDIAGAALAALALGGITYALIEAPGRGSGRIGALAAGVVGVVLAVAFLVVRAPAYPAPDPVAPMLPLDVFGSREFSAVT